MPTKCPSCSAPLKHYINSNHTETDYCEYCNYRHDYPAPDTSLGKHISGMVGNLVGEMFGVQINDSRPLSPIEIMDKEKQERDMLSKMSERERRMYEKQKTLNLKREAAASRAKRFNPKTGMYE